MANSSIALTEIDFDTLRDQFVDHLRSQDEFKDFDLVSSNMRVLVDLLALNTYLNAYLINMIMSEGFLDSAQLKSSLISHAKELNYVPRSARSSHARVRMTFAGGSPTYLLRKGQGFGTVIKSNTYIFSLADSVLVASSNGSFSVDLDLYEGSYVSDTYVVNRNDATQRFLVTNRNVDVDSLAVAVYEAGDLEGQSYRLANTLLGLNETSKRFFVQQAENEMYEVSFGDGVIGYRPPDGSRVLLDYRITHGTDGNGARLFVPNFNPGPTEDATAINVQTISASSEGANSETLESIRYYAPRHFRIQERAVSDSDFAIALKGQFPEISAVSTFGGEMLDPPRFGQVVVAVSLTGVDGLPEARRDAYEAFLRDRMALTMGVMFVDPVRTYFTVRSRVSYNLNQTTLSTDNMRALIASAILDWADEELGEFGVAVRYSKFCKLIDDADRSIVGNDTDLYIYRKLRPRLGVYQSINVDFNMPLLLTTRDDDLDQPGQGLRSVYSGPFVINGVVSRLEDDGGGRVMIVSSMDGVDRFAQQVGTVDYERGAVRLSSFIVDSYQGAYVKLYVRPRSKDVVVDQATVLGVEADEIILDVRAVRE